MTDFFSGLFFIKYDAFTLAFRSIFAHGEGPRRFGIVSLAACQCELKRTPQFISAICTPHIGTSETYSVECMCKWFKRFRVHCGAKKVYDFVSLCATAPTRFESIWFSGIHLRTIESVVHNETRNRRCLRTVVQNANETNNGSKNLRKCIHVVRSEKKSKHHCTTKNVGWTEDYGVIVFRLKAPINHCVRNKKTILSEIQRQCCSLLF